MKNVIVCKNCNNENPFYVWICKHCNSYLRERIFNIDLWKVITLLVYAPQKGFSIIIQSEHKNFIVPIFLFASIKLFIDSIFISLLTNKSEPVFGNFLIKYLITLAVLLSLILLITFIFSFLNKKFGIVTRYRDNLSILIYSIAPHVFALILLFIVELTIFGAILFSNNPSPFTVKEFLAYLFLVFEGIIIVWGILLAINAVYTQSKNRPYSVITGILFNALIFLCLYFNSIFLFK